MLYESYYGVADLGSPYIQHHGVKGQKWGVRRYQNEDGTLTAAGRRKLGFSVGGDNGKPMSRRKFAKTLNKADNLKSDAEYMRRRLEQKYNKTSYKYNKLKSKLEDRAAAKGTEMQKSRKLEKLQSKMEKFQSKQQAAANTKKEISKLTQKTINKAIKQGYTVKSKEVIKGATEGRHLLMYMFSGKGSYGEAASRFISGDTAYIRGRKYNVRKTGKGKTARYVHNKNSTSINRYIARKQLKHRAITALANVAIGTAMQASGFNYEERKRR